MYRHRMVHYSKVSSRVRREATRSYGRGGRALGLHTQDSSYHIKNLKPNIHLQLPKFRSTTWQTQLDSFAFIDSLACPSVNLIQNMKNQFF
jgi:hypothetical protein